MLKLGKDETFRILCNASTTITLSAVICADPSIGIGRWCNQTIPAISTNGSIFLNKDNFKDTVWLNAPYDGHALVHLKGKALLEPRNGYVGSPFYPNYLTNRSIPGFVEDDFNSYIVPMKKGANRTIRIFTVVLEDVEVQVWFFRKCARVGWMGIDCLKQVDTPTLSRNPVVLFMGSGNYQKHPKEARQFEATDMAMGTLVMLPKQEEGYIWELHTWIRVWLNESHFFGSQRFSVMCANQNPTRSYSHTSSSVPTVLKFVVSSKEARQPVACLFKVAPSYVSDTELLLWTGPDLCPHNCNHGICEVIDGLPSCECYQGYTGYDCSRKIGGASASPFATPDVLPSVSSSPTRSNPPTPSTTGYKVVIGLLSTSTLVLAMSSLYCAKKRRIFLPHTSDPETNALL